MSNGNDNTISIFDIFKLSECNTIFVHSLSLVCPRINNNRVNLILVQASDNIVDLAISRIRAILLKCNPKNSYFRFLGCLSNCNHIFDSGISNKFTHTIVHNTTIENNLTVIT